MTFKEWLEENPRECISLAYAEFQETRPKVKPLVVDLEKPKVKRRKK
jgi:hypothetical protein